MGQDSHTPVLEHVMDVAPVLFAEVEAAEQAAALADPAAALDEPGTAVAGKEIDAVGGDLASNKTAAGVTDGQLSLQEVIVTPQSSTEVIVDSFDFAGLPRHVLQELCKVYKIRANMKSSQMVDALQLLALNCGEVATIAKELADTATKNHDKDDFTTSAVEKGQRHSKRLAGDEDSMSKAQRMAARRNLDQVVFRAAHWFRFWSLLQKKERKQDVHKICHSLEVTAMELFASNGWRFNSRICAS